MTNWLGQKSSEKEALRTQLRQQPYLHICFLSQTDFSTGAENVNSHSATSLEAAGQTEGEADAQWVRFCPASAPPGHAGWIPKRDSSLWPSLSRPPEGAAVQSRRISVGLWSVCPKNMDSN